MSIKNFIQKHSKTLTTLAILPCLCGSLMVASYAGTNNLGSGGNYEADFDFGTDDTEDNGEIVIDLTNTHTTSLVNIVGTKTWVDNDNRDGLRPDEITIHLYADGVDTGEIATASEETSWKYEFLDMPEYENGTAIAYTIVEDVPEGYTVRYSDPVTN